jgi:hypothetical protein
VTAGFGASGRQPIAGVCAGAGAGVGAGAAAFGGAALLEPASVAGLHAAVIASANAMSEARPGVAGETETRMAAPAA